MNEAEIKRNARKILRERNIFFIDIQGSRFTTSGAPDMVMVINGLFIAMEFKTYRGTQSQDQKNIQTRLEDAGGFYFMPRSTKELEEIIALFED